MQEPEEEWRPVLGYEGLYEVSDQGNVRSLGRTIETVRGPRRHKGRLLRAYRSDGNYYRVSINNGTGHKWFRVHTLVLEAFVGPRPEGLIACHNDGDHCNNRAGNLRWDTYSANNKDLVTHGTHWQSSKTHCKNGHEFTPANTYYRREGGRKCRVCLHRAKRRWKDKKKTAA